MTWYRTLRYHRHLLKCLPAEIHRHTVTEIAQNAALDEESATRAFVASMVWGYGMRGYGAFRTNRILETNEKVGGTLRQAAILARRDGGPEAFGWLAENRLDWLGVASATKYLYFCGVEAQPARALVLDSRVRNWLHRYSDLRVRLDWEVSGYRRYVETVSDWALSLGVEPADVEYLMFADAPRRGSRPLRAR